MQRSGGGQVGTRPWPADELHPLSSPAAMVADSGCRRTNYIEEGREWLLDGSKPIIVSEKHYNDLREKVERIEAEKKVLEDGRRKLEGDNARLRGELTYESDSGAIW